MDIHHLDIEIPLQDGNLEGRLLYPESEGRQQGVILCPPHPLLAGNIDNNVVMAVAGALAPLMPVLLFNYRGVGKSWSPQPELPLYEFWHNLDVAGDYRAIIADTRQVINWSANCFQDLHIIGYSFGSHIALQAAPDNPLSYIAITPPLAEHDYGRLASLSCPTLALLAENDTLISPGDKEMLNHFDRRLTLPGTDHFFRHREEKVAGQVRELISSLS